MIQLIALECFQTFLGCFGILGIVGLEIPLVGGVGHHLVLALLPQWPLLLQIELN